jgi:DNA repair protein RecN (Recombination protein N)
VGAGPAAGPGTLVFDEVDAGVGGEAALAVGRALAELGRRYQVVVVTHLAQVAAFADAQVAVSKVERGGRTTAQAQLVTGPERVVELSRMLSGQPDSATARRHAEELLQMAAPGPVAAPGLAVPGPRAGGPRSRRRPELR